MYQKCVMIFTIFFLVLCRSQNISSDSIESTTEYANSTSDILDEDLQRDAEFSTFVTHNRTFLIQLRKNGDSYELVNHYNSAEREEGNDDPANMEILPPIQPPPSPKEALSQSFPFRRSTNFIDPEWSYQNSSTTFEYPHIADEIYEAMVENNRHNTMRNASTVRCIFESDERLPNDNMIMFDLSHLQQSGGNEVLVEAELYIYTMKPEESSGEKKSASNDNHILRLFQYLNMSDENNESSVPDVHKLINVVYIPANYAGWQVFKVRGLVEKWLQGAENMGLLLTARDHAEKELELNLQHRSLNGGIHQPTLVLYYEPKQEQCEQDKNSHRVPRKKSMARLSNEFVKLIQRGIMPCDRNLWYLSFQEVGWNNFIIAPSGFMAYKCRGSCQLPLNAGHTNHAKLLENWRGEIAEQPCCVPHKYLPLVVMFFDQYKNVVIKRYIDMIIDECGCR